MKIGLSNVCTAFMASTVGSKVLNKELFMGFLEPLAERAVPSGWPAWR